MNIPNFLLDNATLILEYLNKYEINTPLRTAHFLAQLHNETGGFTAFVERITYQNAQANYQNHKYLGNTQIGDGYRFRGRGLIQLTGRGNYQRFKDFSGIDVVSNPDLAAQKQVALPIACWFWIKSPKGNLNKYADKDDIINITKAVNGGLTAIDNRIKLLAFYKKADILNVLKKKSVN